MAWNILRIQYAFPKNSKHGDQREITRKESEPKHKTNQNKLTENRVLAPQYCQRRKKPLCRHKIPAAVSVTPRGETIRVSNEKHFLSTGVRESFHITRRLRVKSPPERTGYKRRTWLLFCVCMCECGRREIRARMKQPASHVVIWWNSVQILHAQMLTWGFRCLFRPHLRTGACNPIILFTSTKFHGRVSQIWQTNHCSDWLQIYRLV